MPLLPKYVRRAAALFLLCALPCAPALAQGGVLEGEWEIKPLAWRAVPPADSVQLALMRGGPGRSVMGDAFPVHRLTGLGATSASVADGPARFEVRAEAGVISFEGSFQAHRGTGRFTFVADPAFAAAREARGLGRPTPWEQLALALDGAQLAGIDPAPRPEAPSWLGGLPTRTTDAYELYAQTPDDLGVARAELDYAAEQFERAVGPPSQIAVLFLDANPPRGFDATFRERGLRTLAWMTDRGWAAAHAGHGPSRPHSEAHILPHEACHAFLSAYVDGRLGRSLADAPRTRTRHYGHDAVPDWLDEAAAVLCEHADEQGRRTRAFAEEGAVHIPFAEFFSMDHPLSGPIRVSGGGWPGGGAPPPPGTALGSMTFSNTLSAEDAERAVLFYSQAGSVGRFLVERYGEGALGRVAEGLAAGRPVADVLAGLGAPADLAAFERAWAAWAP
ncbi:MAG TPA: hypothetical protein VF576_06245, partial [Rubricoccaceae bacterium]